MFYMLHCSMLDDCYPAEHCPTGYGMSGDLEVQGSGGPGKT